MMTDDLDRKAQQLQNILMDKYKQAGVRFPFKLNKDNYEYFRASHPYINDDGVDISKVIEMVLQKGRMRRQSFKNEEEMRK